MRYVYTFGHIRQLVLAQGLECSPLHLALQLRRDAEEVDGQGDSADDDAGIEEEGHVGNGRGGLGLMKVWFSLGEAEIDVR